MEEEEKEEEEQLKLNQLEGSIHEVEKLPILH